MFRLNHKMMSSFNIVNISNCSLKRYYNRGTITYINNI